MFCYTMVSVVVAAALFALIAGDELHKVEAINEQYSPVSRVPAYGYEGMFR
jgi:hypothetical protein